MPCVVVIDVSFVDGLPFETQMVCGINRLIAGVWFRFNRAGSCTPGKREEEAGVQF